MSKKLQNDWQSIIAKPEVIKKAAFEDDQPDPFYRKREDVYYSIYPPRRDEKKDRTFAFALVPAANGEPFIMTDVMKVSRWKFFGTKTQKDYFENLRLPMDPKYLFDMTVVEKATKDASKLTEEEKKTLENIKRHADLVQRFNNLYFNKVENVNFGYAQKPGKYNNRLAKDALTGFFGVWTKWNNAGNEVENDKREFGVKFISSRYVGFQDKFRNLLTSTSNSHQKLEPEWFQKYFSSIGGVEGVLRISQGSMAVGGTGVDIKLVKLGKDPIDDADVGVTGPITEKDIVLPKDKEDSLSHVHYLMGFNSQEDVWQDDYVDRFEAAIEQLETYVEEMKVKNAVNGPSTDSVETTTTAPESSEADDSTGETDAPF